MKRWRSVRSDIWSGAIVVVVRRPQMFLIHRCQESTGRTRCRYRDSERPSTAGSGSLMSTSPSSWPTAAWAASGRPAAAFRTSAAAAWSGSSGRCSPCASAPCCTPRWASVAGGPSGTPASPSPSAICQPGSVPRRLSFALDSYLQNETLCYYYNVLHGTKNIVLERKKKSRLSAWSEGEKYWKKLVNLELNISVHNVRILSITKSWFQKLFNFNCKTQFWFCVKVYQKSLEYLR